jgi:hypothetical protein
LLQLILSDRKARNILAANLDKFEAEDLFYLDLKQSFHEQNALDKFLGGEASNIDNNVVRSLFRFMGQTDETGLLYQAVP